LLLTGGEAVHHIDHRLPVTEVRCIQSKDDVGTIIANLRRFVNSQKAVTAVVCRFRRMISL